MSRNLLGLGLGSGQSDASSEPHSVSPYRSKVLEIAGAAARAQIGPPSAEYVDITEGRKDKYSWCGCFVTWALARAGANRNLEYINRVELNGQFRIGKTLSLLVDAGKKENSILYGWQAQRAVVDPKHWGDVIIIEWPNGNHVGILAHGDSETVYTTFDGNSLYGKTAVRVRTSEQFKIVALIGSDIFHASAGAIAFPGMTKPSEPGLPTDILTSVLALPPVDYVDPSRSLGDLLSGDLDDANFIDIQGDSIV